ncbi:hypothetical protein RB595_004203 [Gaeumannomyces hyphopodioides]
MIGSSRLLLGPDSRSRLLAQRAVLAGPLRRHVVTPLGIRPPLLSHPSRRWKSAPIEDNIGRITAAKNESIFFFDNIFPLGLSTFFLRRWRTEEDLSELLRKFDSSPLGITDPVSTVKRAIPADLPVTVTEVVPRLKDGGAFVKVSHSGAGSGSETRMAARELEKALARRLLEAPLRSWFNPFASVRVGLVKGVPWLEDLYRPPASRVMVEFCPPNPGDAAVELSQETLYSLFRGYGKLAEIIPQPFDSKVVPRYAYVDFSRVRDAVMARNCLHGLFVNEAMGGGKGGTKLRLSYESKVKPHHIWNWLSGHPRIVIPLVAALLAAFTVAVFDPIREFFIGAHIQGSLNITNSRLYRWCKRQTLDFGGVFKRHNNIADEAGLQALWTQRKDIIDSINTWLLESTDTFIVVQGPRGSGTRELIMDQALGTHDKSNVLVLDCKPVVEARGEGATIRRLAATVGYRPVFSWANSLSSLADLAVQGTTGVKSGFSETLETQIVKILQTTASALKKVSLLERRRGDKDADMSEDAYLEAHPEKRAIVVIDNFLHRPEDGSLVYDKVVDWAAALVQSNIAHVIFLTHDPSYSKSLSRALPDRVFRQVALGDLSPEVAKKYVLSQLEGFDREALSDLKRQNGGKETGTGTRGEPGTGTGKGSGKTTGTGKESGKTEWFHWNNQQTPRKQDLPQPPVERDLSELDTVIDTLGGRLTDLEFLARRLKSGQTPRQAVTDIVEQSSSEIIKMFLLGRNSTAAAKSGAPASEKAWSNEQAWHLIREIAAKGTLRYNEILLSPTFASSTTPSAADGAAAVEALASAELITVTSARGRPQAVKAGRPVYQAAFALLAEDNVLKARMDLAVATELVKIETKKIDKVEAEMALLAMLPKQPAGVGRRAQYLVDSLSVSHGKVVALEAEIEGLKIILKQDA